MGKLGELIARHPTATAAVGLACAVVALLLVGGSRAQDATSPEVPNGELLVAPSSVPVAPELETAPTPDAAPSTDSRPTPVRHRIATVLPGEQVGLREAPGGRAIAKLGARTEFGSDRNLWVVRRRGPWFGVSTELRPNSKLGWILDDGTQLRISRSPWWIAADLSRQTVRLLYGRRVVHRFPVSVGAPGTPTPAGRYAVTDGLTTTGGLEQVYGCCVLALTGRQPNLPSGWIGGDRIAIHGTPGDIGGAVSSGCLRASNADMAALFRRVPLGTPVLIRR